ncbi:Uncharacterised protein g6427 [Pycnogonum litorale]
MKVFLISLTIALCSMPLVCDSRATCRERSQCYEGCVSRFSWCQSIYKPAYPRCDRQLHLCVSSCATRKCPTNKVGTCPPLVTSSCDPESSTPISSFCSDDYGCAGTMKCCPVQDLNYVTCLKLCVPPA